jgi:hypothetical protein
MALIKCPECGKEISDQAAVCPNCGAPNKSSKTAAAPSAPPSAGTSSSSAGGRQSYIDKNLLAGETVVYRTRLHWSKFFGQGCLALGLLVAALFCMWAAHSTPFFGYVGLLLFLGVVLIGASIAITAVTSEFAVTNKRVLIKVGFIQRTSFELLLRQVESILVEQGIFGRILGFGTIIVIGTGGSKEDFDYIADPLEFRKQVQSQIASH